MPMLIKVFFKFTLMMLRNESDVCTYVCMTNIPICIAFCAQVDDLYKNIYFLVIPCILRYTYYTSYAQWHSSKQDRLNYDFFFPDILTAQYQ